jgi:putative membrane protein
MRNSTITALITCVTLAAAAGTAQAQDSGIERFGKNLGAGVVEGLKAGAGIVPETDKQFIISAASGGIAEVEMARIALEKTRTPQVKRHAQQMINDHTQANDELRRIASAKGVALPESPNANHRAMVDRLRSTPERDFDETYVREAGINAHQEMRTLFRNQSNSGTDPDIRAFAAKTLPTVETHLKHSERIEDDLRAERR